MSHTVQIQTEVRDPVTVRDACSRLNTFHGMSFANCEPNLDGCGNYAVVDRIDPSNQAFLI